MYVRYTMTTYRVTVNKRNFYFEAETLAKATKICRGIAIVHASHAHGLVLVEHDQAALEYGTQIHSNVIPLKQLINKAV
jgi:hypothetical protein